jgi:glucose/arabinose dehydrogenase
LRINKDGTIPSDNPFYATASDKNRAIWALGLRNPFKIAVKPGALFVNDVGEHDWEEINRGTSGANYGWPTYEGIVTSSPNLQNYKNPLLAYPHSVDIDPSAPATGCAITGGAFYNPATIQFPDYHVGDYFFADVCSGWIRRYDVAPDKSHNFATGLTSVVDLEVSEDGELYYLSRGDSANPALVGKISRPSP